MVAPFIALLVDVSKTLKTAHAALSEDSPQRERLGKAIDDATLGFMLSPQFGGLVAYTDTVSERTASPDVNTWTFRLQYVW